MLRKHVNQLDINDEGLENSIPFKSWECITVQLERRDVDLVIHNEDDMMDFLTVLIHKINTIDGHRNSAIIF